MLVETTRLWRSARVTATAQAHMPALPGVYVIADVLAVASLRLRVEPVYVGKTNNLRRRFGEHLDPRRTHSASLSRRLTAGPRNSKFELWFQVLERSEISRAEKMLIKALQPETNLIRYGEENEL